MKQDKDHIKDIFCSKLKGFEADLPASFWNKIETELPVTPSVKMPLRRVVFQVASWTAATAAIVVLALLFMPENKGVYISKSREDKRASAVHSFAKLKIEDRDEQVVGDKIQKASPLVRSSKVWLATSSNEVTLDSKSNLELGHESSSENGVIQNETVPENENVYIAETKKTGDFEPKDPTFEKELQAKIEAFEAAGENSKSILADNSVVDSKSKKIKGESKGLTLGLEGGGGFSKVHDVTNASRYAMGGVDGPYELRSQQYKLEHNQPVTFGVAVNKKITDRISLESGVVYTYVSAKIKLEGKPEYNQDDKQYFHYFGIPLSVNYRFAKWNKAEFYASLGGVVQKDFYGRIEGKSSIDDLLNTERTSKRDISQSRPQFSATGMLGVSYPLYNKLSVYTNLGGAYYFKANNEYETIFSDRPWMFNFNLGLKFGF